MKKDNWIRTSKPNKSDKIPLSLFNLNLTEYQELCNGCWYYYNNFWIPTIWIVDNYQLTYIQLDIYGNEVSRCQNCNNGFCSNNHHNIHWQKLRFNQIQELQTLNFQLNQEIERLNYINIKQAEEIEKLRISSST